jgi:hypothetical protein
MDQDLVPTESGLPPWEFVAAYVAACHATASAAGRDTTHLGLLPDWRQYYQNVSFNLNKPTCPLLRICSLCRPSEATGAFAIALSQLSEPKERRDTLDDSQRQLVANEIELLTSSNLQPGTAILFAVNAEIQGTRFPLNRSRMILGRDQDCEISIKNRFVSREHAVIRISGGDISIRDLNSMYGTYLNDDRIARDTLLHHQDIIVIGGLKLVLLKKPPVSWRS